MTYWIAPSVNKRFTTYQQIMRYVAETCCVTEQEIVSRSRKRNLVDARHLANFFIRRECIYMSLSSIGKLMGRDHATVIHSVKTYNQLITCDSAFKEKSMLIELKIKQI